MLRPEYLAGVADSVVEIFSQVEQDIADDIARRIIKNGYMTDTAQWQIRKGREFGMLREDVNKTLAKATGKTKREISKIMSEAGSKSLEYDDAIYRAAGLSPASLKNSPALQAMLLQGTDTTLALIGNFTKTTAQMSTIAFNNILDRAYLQILSGAFDPNTAIKRAIKEVATTGVEKIAYPSGASTSIEAAVRRAVTTGVNQSVSKLSLARAEEMGCELVETSSHAGARPSHAEWQGRVFCIKGHHKDYGDFYRETDYGSGEGLCGWNCYHSFYPFFEGLSTRSFSEDPSRDAGRDNDEDYEFQQKQRYYERQIRSAKKECEVYNAAIDATENEEMKRDLKSEFENAALKLKNREAKLQAFLNNTGRTRLREREYISGWNKSISQKAVSVKTGIVKRARTVYNNGAIIDSEQFGRKIGKHAGDFGYDVTKQADRREMESLINRCVREADSVRMTMWRGQGKVLSSGERANGRVFVFQKGDDVVLTTQNGDFVSILKDGMLENKRIKKSEVLFNGD